MQGNFIPPLSEKPVRRRYPKGRFAGFSPDGMMRGLKNNPKHMEKKANSAFMKPMNVSADLAAVVGKGPMPRSEVVKGLWAYIKKNNLQDEKNKRNINADANLK